MIALIVFLILHIFLFGVAVFCAKLAEYRDIIDECEMAIIIAIFIPLGVFVWLAAMFLADRADDFLDDYENQRRRR